MEEKIFDLIIVGSGPAGCTASIYASRYKLKNLVLGKVKGGTITYAHTVDNYPGLNGLSGVDIMEKIEAHVQSLGSQIIYDPVDNIQKNNQGFAVITDSGQNYQAKAVILATGTERRKLEVPGEEELIGKGVSYCVTCDAPFYRGKTVALIGGSDAACSGAVHLSEYTQKIFLIYRKDSLRAEPFWVNQWKKLVEEGKGEEIFETNVVEIISKDIAGRKVVGGIRLDKPYNGSQILSVDGVFIEIGGAPGTKLAKGLNAAVDEQGYVKVNDQMETDIPGLFAAGDMIDKAKIMSQMITACAWGAIAASSAYKYLKGQRAPQQKGT